MDNKIHKWDLRFLDLAKLVSTWSDDESTKVGAVIVGTSNEIRSTGFNGFPRRIKNSDDRKNRPKKYFVTEHAERNAIFQCCAHWCVYYELHFILYNVPLRGLCESNYTMWYRSSGYTK